MKKLFRDPPLVVGLVVILVFGVAILHSVAPFIFPLYWVFIGLAILAFIFFSQTDFDILLIFNRHFFVASLFFLILPLIVGQATRGALRWLVFGALTVQPAEIVRPFLFLFWANLLKGYEYNLKNILKLAFLVLLPVGLVFVQPSLGVAILTFIGFIGVFFSSGVTKKVYLFGFLAILLAIPVGWHFMAPYQKERVLTFISPWADPAGAGYNTIQSMIAVGSGRLTGRGLGEGVQTQLAFLPERHTDFIFASIAEEMGFLGASLVILGVFFLLSRIIAAMDRPVSPVARAFLSGVFLSLFAQVVVHVGMNMGLLPITGVPLPLVSAGGSSLVATTATLGMVVAARKP